MGAAGPERFNQFYMTILFMSINDKNDKLKGTIAMNCCKLTFYFSENTFFQFN